MRKYWRRHFYEMEMSEGTVLGRTSGYIFAWEADGLNRKSALLESVIHGAVGCCASSLTSAGDCKTATTLLERRERLV